MKRHKHFDLLLHNRGELQNLLGEAILDCSPLHEWPLSSVQLVQTVSGRRFIYKATALVVMGVATEESFERHLPVFEKTVSTLWLDR